MKNKLVWIAAVLMSAGTYYLFDWAVGLRPQPASPPTAIGEAKNPPKTSPAVIGRTSQIAAPTSLPPEATQILPALEASDKYVKDAFVRLLGRGVVSTLLVPEQIVRRIVATIDNLPRQTVAVRLRPLRPVDGTYEVVRNGEEITIGDLNAKRYAYYVNAAEMVDVPSLVDIYIRFYPLFQQAYQELGYPKGQFNNRLLEAIADLLDTPELLAPPLLVQPKVLYQFADHDLEERSAGQKLLMRMGMANEKKIKAVLRSFRAELAQRFPRR